MHHPFLPRLLAAVLGLGAPVLAHADTSATLATAINIPKGPASIEGFGRAYEISPASGLPSLNYPLEVPPGRAGHAPQLALHYHAGGGAGVLGLGWSLDLPAIERSTRAGLPRADIPPVWQLRHVGDGEELTETAPGVYRQRIEQGPPIVVRTLPGGAMSAVATDGTGYLFGLTDDARLIGDAGLVRLELSAITDVHGNRIDFHYTRAAGSDAPLLSAITWNDGQALVEINYEARPDILVSHATGQRLAFAHRIHQIRTEVAGEPVRTTTLTYARSIEAPSSRLTAIATVAADGTALPTWRMTYTGEAATPVAHKIPGAPALDPTAEGRAWVDGDALPDLLDAEPDAWRFRKNIGDTRLAATWTDLASPAVLLAPTTRFADLTGDGVQDLLAQPSPGELWRFLGGGATPFGVAEPIALDLSFDLSDARVALADMNLDGRVDVLRHDADGWLWLRLRDGAAYEPAEALAAEAADQSMRSRGSALLATRRGGLIGARDLRPPAQVHPQVLSEHAAVHPYAKAGGWLDGSRFRTGLEADFIEQASVLALDADVHDHPARPFLLRRQHPWVEREHLCANDEGRAGLVERLDLEPLDSGQSAHEFLREDLAAVVLRTRGLDTERAYLRAVVEAAEVDGCHREFPLVREGVGLRLTNYFPLRTTGHHSDEEHDRAEPSHAVS